MLQKYISLKNCLCAIINISLNTSFFLFFSLEKDNGNVTFQITENWNLEKYYKSHHNKFDYLFYYWIQLTECKPSIIQKYFFTF